MIATGAIDLHEIALPEILNPRRIQGQHPLKTVWLMGALLLIAALNSAATASLKAGAISVLCFVLILAPRAGREICRACERPTRPPQ
jgi:hypothetical protein